ncbi:MAG TPA: CDP-alcohol phosphatidyltransferase family protein [Dongiaceae bacterium]|nr:CDP-alcohol phosphatidyltransferase family protein [Dongiaceae bacterium]
MLNVLKRTRDRFMTMLERRGISREDLRRDWRLLPNWISYVRLALCWVPAVMLVLWFGNQTVRWVAFGLFVGLALTDWVDGLIARHWDMTSEWGKLIDPLGDKFLVAFTVLAVLAIHWDGPNGLLLALTVWVIFAREFILTAQIRLARQGVASPTNLGKVKTAVQFVLIAALVMPITWPDRTLLWALAITFGLTLLSWWEYYTLYVRPFRQSRCPLVR